MNKKSKDRRFEKNYHNNNSSNYIKKQEEIFQIVLEKAAFHVNLYKSNVGLFGCILYVMYTHHECWS